MMLLMKRNLMRHSLDMLLMMRVVGVMGRQDPTPAPVTHASMMMMMKHMMIGA